MLSSSISLTKIGLKPHQYALIREAVLQDSRVERAWIFGSRALGTFKDGSDIDIALEGEALTLDDMARMLERLEYSTLPFRVDLQLKHKIMSPELLAHIEQYGLQIK
ncbi:nucleotidyltransferase family protein [Vibrio cholerae]|uniref:nucleotidyltransferase family protein n=1 Tax=Vibrio cholerae TaxID=666 RepID=UPI001C2FB18C|nr:nucleotidyltransferase domain-containing protein [Vibrio cholerae]MCD1212376.1 nucleotidyltransferase [Vibrio cholerae]HDZ9270822.1 nucleotidyltransferase domain-containing protein [Vibrio cholerae]